MISKFSSVMNTKASSLKKFGDYILHLINDTYTYIILNRFIIFCKKTSKFGIATKKNKEIVSYLISLTKLWANFEDNFNSEYIQLAQGTRVALLPYQCCYRYGGLYF